MIDKVCPECGKQFETPNMRKVYCSQKCNKNAYIKRRYKRDVKFNERIRRCWAEYGLDKCPKCGRLKRRTESICRYCSKIYTKINIFAMIDDSESLFGSPESLLKMEIMMFSDAHPDLKLEEIFEVFKGTEYGVGDEKIKEIIKTILEER